MRDPYEVLGVRREAPDAEVKAAYRRLAKELHPDRNPDNPRAAERFKEVSAAYGVVGDPAQRARFDRGEIGPDGRERGFADTGFRPGGFRARTGNAEGVSPEDIFGNFEDLFGQFGRRAGRDKRGARGADRTFKLTVDFLDAALGTTRRINLPTGRMVDVRIPAGIESGRTIRLKGQGDGEGTHAGDALIEVTVAEHPHFRREGRDVHLDLPISLPEALFGAKVAAPTVHGPVTVTVPAGANSGLTLRLRGKGIAADGEKAAGDQYIHLSVMLPDPPDPRLNELVEEWARQHPYDVRRKAGLA